MMAALCLNFVHVGTISLGRLTGMAVFAEGQYAGASQSCLGHDLVLRLHGCLPKTALP